MVFEFIFSVKNVLVSIFGFLYVKNLLKKTKKLTLKTLKKPGNINIKWFGFMLSNFKSETYSSYKRRRGFMRLKFITSFMCIIYLTIIIVPMFFQWQWEPGLWWHGRELWCWGGRGRCIRRFPCSFSSPACYSHYHRSNCPIPTCIPWSPSQPT